MYNTGNQILGNLHFHFFGASPFSLSMWLFLYLGSYIINIPSQYISFIVAPRK